MKKAISFLLTLGVLAAMPGLVSTAADETFYSYMNYYNHIGNEAGIDWLEAAHAAAPEEVLKFYGNEEKQYKPNPLLDEFPEKTAFVYRTANFYGGQAAVRNNTSVMVFSDKSFENPDQAYEYLDSIGMIGMIDSLTGSVVLVTPSDPENGFGEADLQNYYNLHDAMYHQRTFDKLDDESFVYHADAEYFGSYGKVYLVGIDGGATFINDYVAPGRFDCIGLASGVLLAGGEMKEGTQVSNYVPVYLLNGSDTAADAYRLVNETDAYSVEDGREVFYNTDAPLRRVMTAEDENPDLAKYVEDAFNSLFLDAQRLSVIRSYEQETLHEPFYTDYVEAPEISRYALCKRNAIVDGKTKDGGLNVSFHQEEIFSEYKTMYDQYLQSWYEVLPQEVIDNTAPAGSVPLILALHGTGDDPLMYVDEIGLLEVAGQEGLAVVAPFEEELVVVHEGARVVMGVPIYEGIGTQVWPMLIDYMLEKYPALDASSVYATGYYLGGGYTYRAVYGGLEKVAAVVPMAGMHDDMIYPSTPEEDAALDAVDMPCMILTSTFDLGFNQEEGRLTDNTLKTVDIFCKANNIDVPEFDFEKYPMIGLPSDEMDVFTIGGEWRSFLWSMENEAGVPMVNVSCTENLTHSLYPGYGELAWNYMKHFSRNQETGSVEYQP